MLLLRYMQEFSKGKLMDRLLLGLCLDPIKHQGHSPNSAILKYIRLKKILHMGLTYELAQIETLCHIFLVGSFTIHMVR